MAAASERMVARFEDGMDVEFRIKRFSLGLGSS